MALLGHHSAEMSLRYGRLFDATVRTEYERALDLAKQNTPTGDTAGSPGGRTQLPLTVITGGRDWRDNTPVNQLLYPFSNPDGTMIGQKIPVRADSAGTTRRTLQHLHHAGRSSLNQTLKNTDLGNCFFRSMVGDGLFRQVRVPFASFAAN